MFNDLGAIVAFVLTVLFFIWFGATLNSINRHLANLNILAEQSLNNLRSISGVDPIKRDEL
jgi:hypothetical protein